jgi:predicted ATPase
MLSVFSASDLAAIEAIGGAALKDVSAVDALGSLVDKSLVRVVDSGAGQRFTMLLMIKEFAAEKLAESPDRAVSVAIAHATYFAEMVDRKRELLHGAGRRTAIGEMEADLGNLKTAWGFWIQERNVDQVLRMIEGMWAMHEAKGWYRSAIDLADDAIEVLERADPTPELASERLAVRMSLARATMAQRGYGPEAEEAYETALRIIEDEGVTARQFPVLRALATYFMGTGRFAKGAEIGEQLLELGQAGDESMMVEGHYVYGAGMSFSGRLSPGVMHLEKAIELHDPTRHDVGRFRLGPNTGVVARTAQGLMQFQCGALERGISRVQEALEVARAIDHPYSIAYGLHHNALLGVYRQRFEEAVVHTQELAVVSDQNDYPVWRTLATTFEGVATAFLGDPQTGLAMTEQGIELYSGLTAPPVFWPQLLGFRAMVHGAAGRPERGLELVGEAMEIVTADVVNAAEFQIIRGDLQQMLGDDADAERSYLAAASGAAQGTLNLIEVQALNRLVELRRGLGKTPDGSEGLAAVYGRFTEGLAEHDLVIARDLLAER